MLLERPAPAAAFLATGFSFLLYECLLSPLSLHVFSACVFPATTCVVLYCDGPEGVKKACSPPCGRQ